MDTVKTGKNIVALKAPKTSYVEEAKVNYNEHLQLLKETFFVNYNAQTNLVTDKSNFAFFGSIWPGHYDKMIFVKHKETLYNSVAKRLEKTNVIKTKMLKQVYLQKNILTSIKFPFIITLEYTTKDFCNIFFVYPFAIWGDLLHYVRKCINLKEKDAIFYGAQMLLAIEYLHNLGLIFRNLRPENIVLQANGYIKLTNFQFCKFLTNHRTYTLCGTPEYLAPEMIQMKGYGFSIDWWFFGIVLYEMIAGHTPFYSADALKCAENITEGKLKFNENFSMKIRHLIKNLLQVDLSKRYGNLKNGSSDIKNHDWFQVIDWQAIYHRKIIPPYKPSPIFNITDLEEAPNRYEERTDCDTYSKEFEYF